MVLGGLRGGEQGGEREDFFWTFSPNRKYNIYVFGIDANGKRTTDVYYEQRSTLPRP